MIHTKCFVLYLTTYRYTYLYTLLVELEVVKVTETLFNTSQQHLEVFKAAQQ